MSTVTVSTRKSAKVKRSRYTPVSDLPSAATCTDSDSTATRTGTDNYWNWPSAATRTDSDDYRIGLNPRPIRVGLNPRPFWPFSTVQAGWMRWQLKKQSLKNIRIVSSLQHFTILKIGKSRRFALVSRVEDTTDILISRRLEVSRKPLLVIWNAVVFCNNGPAGAYFNLGFFLSCQII